MEFQQLRGFIAAARRGSISRAAKDTYRSQPAVSRQIQALETELQATLFERDGPKRLELTDEGKLFYNFAAPLLEDLESLPLRFNDARTGSHTAKLTIATHSSVMVYVLPDIIKEYQRRFPQVDMTIINRPRESIIDMVKSGEADLGVTSLSKTPPGIDYKPFARFKRLLVLPKSHPLSKIKKITLKALSTYPLIISPRGSNTRDVIDKAFSIAGLEYKVALEATGRDTIKTYVRMGLGISVINEYYVTAEEKKGLSVKDASSLFGFAERGLITRKSKYHSHAARELMRLIKGC